MMFKDRQQAGTLLAQKLLSHRGKSCCIVGLARGGVAVAKTIARDLNLPLDVLVVKKIGAPGQKELAVGALAPDGVSYIDWRLTQRLGVDEDFVKSQTRELAGQIKQKTLLYRKGRKALPAGRQAYAFREKIVILVDDGAATGATIEVAIRWLRKKHANGIVVALPVVPKEVMPKIVPEVDEVVVLVSPSEFSAVGQFYKDFPQIPDAEVVELLE